MMNIQDILRFADQRWYVYDSCKGSDRNTYDLILDFKTGLLWVNGDKYNYSFVARKKNEIDLSFEKRRFSWRLPTFEELEYVAIDHSFPLHASNSGAHCLYTQVGKKQYDTYGGLFPFYISNINDEIKIANLDVTPIEYCTDRDDYENIVIAVTDEFKKTAVLQCSLGDYIKRCGLNCIDDSEIILRLKSIYDACISLSVMCQIKVKFGISPEFQDSTCQAIFNQLSVEYGNDVLNKNIFAFFNTESLDKFPILYCKYVKSWISILEEIIESAEEKNKDAIIKYNNLSLKLTKKYENSDQLTDEENDLLRDRQRYFASRFSLGMNSVKSKLLAVKHQADELEYRIDEIDNGDDAIHQLALLEKEERASFSFIAENTAKIIRNALKKIEFFEANHQYVVWAIEAWEQWTEKYKIFRTTYREELKGSCEEDGIEEEIWQKWFTDWQTLRFRIEQKFQPIVEHELRERVAMVKEDEISAAQQIIAELEVYRNAVDTFYREERKGIYQNFAFQSNGDIQDKLEAESKLYKLTADFQNALQSIVFNCAKAEDRIFILNWANDLLDIQIDDVLALISDNDLDKISETILTEFSELKKKNYEIYLADAKSYGEEQARRDKQFNSLLFKMRKGLK